MSQIKEGIIAATSDELLRAVTEHNKIMDGCTTRRLLCFEGAGVLEMWIACVDYCCRHACLGKAEKEKLTNSILDIIKQAGVSAIWASKVISQ